MRRGFLIGLVGLAISACASTPETNRFTGVYDWHFETSAFTTDRGAGPYWLVADGAMHQQLTAPLQASGRGPYGRVAVVVEGNLSSSGRFGHLGAYLRELHVTRVIDARLLSADNAPQGS